MSSAPHQTLRYYRKAQIRQGADRVSAPTRHGSLTTGQDLPLAPGGQSAQLAFVGIFCGFARARLERNQDLRNQQVAVRDTMLGAEPRNLLICPNVVSDQDRKNSLRRRLPLSL